MEQWCTLFHYTEITSRLFVIIRVHSFKLTPVINVPLTILVFIFTKIPHNYRYTVPKVTRIISLLCPSRLDCYTYVTWSSTTAYDIFKLNITRKHLGDKKTCITEIIRLHATCSVHIITPYHRLTWNFTISILRRPHSLRKTKRWVTNYNISNFPLPSVYIYLYSNSAQWAIVD